MQLQPNLGQNIQQSQNSNAFLDEAAYLAQQKLLELKKTEDENYARKWLIDATFTLTVLWLIFVATVFVCYGKGCIHYSDGVMITFLTTTTANTLAFLTIIFRYLFHKPKPQTTQVG